MEQLRGTGLDSNLLELREMDDSETSLQNSLPSASTKPHQPAPKHKDRHIVTWTQQEDDLLREQVGIHGTENSWTSIASQFNDKTSRQCRRRWYTYLNAECKKGGWSPEEDIILCEAQKIFGNRWTEIAKVVSGRTDNAVKNRFNTLCKKRAKHEVVSEENGCSSVNLGNSMAMFPDGNVIETTSQSSTKKIRYQLSELNKNHDENERLHIKSGDRARKSRPPLSILDQNMERVRCFRSNHFNVDYTDIRPNDELKSRFHGAFIKRDDPKIIALMEQADLLSSLAEKVNTDNSNQSLEDAWKELRDYLIQTGECGPIESETSDIDSLLGDFKELIDDLSTMNSEREPSVRRLDSQESQANSNSIFGDACTVKTPETEEHNNAECMLNHNNAADIVLVDEKLSLPNEEVTKNGVVSTLPKSDFSSPLQTVPPFRSFAEVIPSPKFTASERHFLLSILGLSSPSSNPKSSQKPSCKRALLHSL